MPRYDPPNVSPLYLDYGLIQQPFVFSTLFQASEHFRHNEAKHIYQQTFTDLEDVVKDRLRFEVQDGGVSENLYWVVAGAECNTAGELKRDYEYSIKKFLGSLMESNRFRNGFISC